METTLGPIQKGIAILIGIIFVISVYSSYVEYVNKKRALSKYMYKIVREISTGREYTAVMYSLSFVDEGSVYLIDVKNHNTYLEVHPNEIIIVKEIPLIGSGNTLFT